MEQPLALLLSLFLNWLGMVDKYGSSLFGNQEINIAEPQKIGTTNNNRNGWYHRLISIEEELKPSVASRGDHIITYCTKTENSKTSYLRSTPPLYDRTSFSMV